MAFWNNKDEPKERRLDFMTNEETKMIDDFLTKISQNRGEMEEIYSRWEAEQEAYSGSQPIEEDSPNSRVNIVNANIEGQVAMVIDQNLAVMCKGNGPSDQGFADWGRIGLDWTLKKNQIKKKIDRHERRRFLFGSGVFSIDWDADAINGFGLVKINTPPLNTTFVDTKITDVNDVQKAEYIAEVMPASKIWAVEQFGDIAYNINYGGGDKSSIWRKERTTDDENLFWYIKLWTKTNGILRLIEFSDDGVLLSDSFKEWTGKKFKDIKDPVPYYRYNKYPYFFTNEYFEEGQFWGFGDGKLLRPLQDLINDLYDQIRRAARPNRVFFDPASEVDLADIDSNDGSVPCIDPNRNIRVVEAGTVNPALWQLLNNIHTEVQRVIRFSELMIGQGRSTGTATEAAIQQQQGTSGIDHKKGMLQETLIEMCEYILDIMMEKYDAGRAFRLDENKDAFQWVDFRQLNNVPIMIPASEGFTQDFKNRWPDKEVPQFEVLKDKQGNEMTKTVDLDIEITIGAGMPKNKAFLWQMAERLGAIILEGKQLISWAEMRKFCKDFLGMPLDDDIDMTQSQQPMPGQMPGQPQMPQQGADIAGLSPNSQPMGTGIQTGAMAGGGMA